VETIDGVLVQVFQGGLMQAGSIIKNGTFGKIVVPEDEFSSFERHKGLEWYENDSITLCLTGINLLRKKFDIVDVIDIGSDPGYFSIPFSKFTNGRVYSYRVIEESKNLLIDSIILNAIHNISILQPHPTKKFSVDGTVSSLRNYEICDDGDPVQKTYDATHTRLLNLDSSKESLNFILRERQLIIKNRPVIFLMREVDNFPEEILSIIPNAYYIVFLSFGTIFIPKELFWSFYFFVREGFILESKMIPFFKEFSRGGLISKYALAKQSLYKFRWKFKLLPSDER
jgi:hypothetical protein